MTTPTAGRRHELDALRGLAAASILAYHAFAMVAPSREALWLLFCSPAFPIVNGRPAVILFFVLSGFVLHGALSAEQERRGRVDYRGFILKRVCRIYLPFAAAAFLALVMATLAVRFGTLATEAVPKPMAGWPAAASFEPSVFAGLLTLSGVETDMALNSVAWSLVHELRISLVLPALFLLVRSRGAATLLVATAPAWIACQALESPVFASIPPTMAEATFQSFSSVAASLTATIYYLPMFLMGALAAERAPRLWALLDRLGPAKTAACFLAGYVLLWWPNDIAAAVGAALLVVLVARSGTCRRLAGLRAPAFLGRVSYSLYLIHLPLLQAVVLVFGGVLGAPLSLLLGVVLAIPAAALFARTVEAPSQRLGRRLAERPAPLAAALAPAE
ncbi:acyltransferase [Chelatococcus sambhunathii]|uniref:Acyltransferase n=1 Tax=Chelatococcus sambhunathii TaxID=363953 RepID=A0ABU1DAF5_9HYPH|nr:acyltransferase [Chelatococcus sambhunathii]MDR4305093.1 acyltransferase [Chelatococcus sambhunathii]